MTLKLIGAGFGRTGTTSLKLAYEQLGLGRCYHMREVRERPDSIGRWIAAADGHPDWEAIFEGYTATVDWPGCTFWRELMDYYPHAKVLLTVRDPEKWFTSTQNTIFSFRESGDSQAKPPPGMGEFFTMLEKVIDVLFDGDLHDHDRCIEVFNRHNAEVIRTVPPEKLLVYDVKEGWEPLCRFLGVPVPATPFPRENTSQEWRERGPSPLATGPGTGDGPQ